MWLQLKQEGSFSNRVVFDGVKSTSDSAEEAREDATHQN